MLDARRAVTFSNQKHTSEKGIEKTIRELKINLDEKSKEYELLSEKFDYLADKIISLENKFIEITQ